MALKDWKKTRNDRDFIYFSNTKSSTFVLIAKYVRPVKKNLWWYVNIPSDVQNNKITHDSQFKTKTQAFKFAKTYMKKNSS